MLRIANSTTAGAAPAPEPGTPVDRVIVGARVQQEMPVVCDGPGVVVIHDGVCLGYALAPKAGDGEVRLQARTPASRIEIGAGTIMCNNISMIAVSRIDIGAGCLIGSELIVMDCDFHDLSPAARRDPVRRSQSVGRVGVVSVGDNVWIGIRVTILRDAIIGNGSVIAAGSVVGPGRYPDNALIAGVPARVVRILDEEPPS